MDSKENSHTTLNKQMSIVYSLRTSILLMFITLCSLDGFGQNKDQTYL